jgi:hypothetical protein
MKNEGLFLFALKKLGITNFLVILTFGIAVEGA